MSVFQAPEGVEFALKIYLVGNVLGVDTHLDITVGGLTAFVDSTLRQVDVQSLVKTQRLDRIGTDWRVMTRDEIKTYKAANAEEVER